MSKAKPQVIRLMYDGDMYKLQRQVVPRWPFRPYWTDLGATRGIVFYVTYYNEHLNAMEAAKKISRSKHWTEVDRLPKDSTT